ncbi:hypothetical protein THASP1DRAFT_24845 [Thamnocephalis sphaerospora]|uniref:Uncharacterized protein n=1 Tax=Thamnocephalis sphaerospora TaxID=78915 RepID=A0A4P9XM49_9FUNG|nr:hypothetical protein THASP1DRAFT_24845 [Thamnocephalis sphaerospora]|eukprot:RKP06912.1 hypothetical protein THASP1DRAFT_24845 [Thamnocephalis sphaerospora]
MALLVTTGDKANLLLEKKWLRRAKAYTILPVLSRNLLVLWKGRNEYTMLSLSDGTWIHRAYYGCWELCGLYPPESQWDKIPKDAVWKDPRDNDDLAHFGWPSRMYMTPAKVRCKRSMDASGLDETMRWNSLADVKRHAASSLGK